MENLFWSENTKHISYSQEKIIMVRKHIYIYNSLNKIHKQTHTHMTVVCRWMVLRWSRRKDLRSIQVEKNERLV